MDLYIPAEIKHIGKILNDSGYQCYLVGGAIRNQLLGKKAKDFDLTTDAQPNKVMKLFKRVIPTGIKHGTVTILYGDHAFEITTYRIDGKYTDGRRPDKIEFTPSINEDLLRRDFTINSLALNVQTEEILDINGGIEDLNNGLIRAIGTPSRRFDEDALRLVRACRFASQLNFQIEEETYKAMSTTLSMLGAVSKERIAEELIKILKSNHPSIAFLHFFNCGMLEILFPDLFAVASADFNIYSKALQDMDSIKSNYPQVKFARLLSIINNKKHLSFLKKLKLSNNFINLTIDLLKFINTDLNSLLKPENARILISRIGKVNIHKLTSLWSGMHDTDSNILVEVEETIKEQIDNNYPFAIKDLAINGTDLIKNLNLKPGPEIGNILSNVLDYVLKHPEKNDKDHLLINIKTFF